MAVGIILTFFFFLPVVLFLFGGVGTTVWGAVALMICLALVVGTWAGLANLMKRNEQEFEGRA